MTEPLRLERTFDASAEDVFDAWTNPLVLVRWWAAFPDWDSPGAEVDWLVYTWSYEGEEHESLVTVGFTQHGERTTVVLVHAGLPSDESRRRHDEGWRGTFDNLERRVLGNDHRR